MANRSGNGGTSPQFTWTNIIATLVFGAILVGAGWTVMLTLQSAERERNTLINAYHDKALDLLASTERERAAVLADISKERRDLLQQQIDRRDGDLARRIAEITKELANWRTEFLTVRQFMEFKELVQADRARLKTIEDTRPTAETLSSVASGAKDQLTKLEERIRSLEDNLRPARTPNNR